MTNRIKAILTAILLIMAVSAIAGTAAADLPATFDWRDNDGNYVTPVKSQETCGACWAFGAIGIIESSILVEHDYIQEIDLSEQYYISDCWGGGDCDTAGSDAASRVLAHAVTRGVVSEDCVPYLEANSPCYRCDGWESNLWYITNRSSAPYSPEALKPIIMKNGPVMGRMDDCYFYYPGWSYANAHQVIIVGWNDSVGCWIVKNSWGTTWGDNGYGLASYGDVRSICYVNGSYNPNYGPCDAYDTNQDCEIDISEMGNALDDWYADIISMGTLGEVLDCWHAGAYC